MSEVLDSNAGLKGKEVWFKRKMFGDVLHIGHFPTRKINLDKDIFSVTILDTDSAKRFVGSAAAGLAGAVILGPLGLVAGVLAGGNKKSGIFLIQQGGEKHVIQTTNKKLIAALVAKAATGVMS